MGVWAICFIPIALVKNSPLRFLSIGFFSGLALFTIHAHSMHTIPTALHGSARFNATVQSDPMKVLPQVRGSYRSAPTFAVTATLNQFGEIHTHLPIRIYLDSAQRLTPSEVVEGYGRFTTSHDRTISGSISAPSVTTVRTPNRSNRIAERIRGDFASLSHHFGSDAAALVPGMVLGDTAGESQEFLRAMKRSGLTHLSAVSGENFAIIALALIWLLKWPFPRSIALRNLLTFLALSAFLIIVRPSPSVLRAAVMTSIFLLSRSRGHRAHSLNSLGCAIAILIILNPFEAQSFGFALSVASTAGIILFSKRIEHAIQEKVKSQALATSLAIPLSATLLCTPIIILLSGQASVSSLPANIASSFAVSPITILGLLAALVAPLSLPLATIIFKATLPFAWWISFVAHIAASVPVLAFPKNPVGALIPIAVAVLVSKRTWRLMFVLLLAFGAFTFHLDSTWPGKNWEIVNCDVGQGDGLVLKAGEHSAIVIDVGPDPLLMSKCLKRLSIREIPLLVLTHFHADHVTGLSTVLKGRSVSQVWISHETEPSYEYQHVIKELAGIPIHVVSQGERFRITPSISISVLWPLKNSPPLSMRSDGSEINNQSVALIINLPGVSLFAGGDIESESQFQILASGLVHPVDLLKVSHHGSRNQYWPLLEALKPKAAFISVGKGNIYGHPAPLLLKELASRRIPTYRTDLDGALAFDSHLSERSMHRQWWRVGLD